MIKIIKIEKKTIKNITKITKNTIKLNIISTIISTKIIMLNYQIVKKLLTKIQFKWQ